ADFRAAGNPISPCLAIRYLLSFPFFFQNR
ncbi:MAG: hypothetical protein ACI8XW_003391, partial [Gammaproteobacteria bacterium]